MSSGTSSPEIVQNPEAEELGQEEPARERVEVEDASVEQGELEVPGVPMAQRDRETPPNVPRVQDDEAAVELPREEWTHQGQGDRGPDPDFRVRVARGPNSIDRNAGEATRTAVPDVAALQLDDEEDEVSEIQPRPLRRLSRELNMSGLIRETPKKRSTKKLVEEARRQSLGLYRVEDDDSDFSSTSSPSVGGNWNEFVRQNPQGLPTLDGTKVNVSTRARISAFTPTRLWRKEDRAQLAPEARQHFIKAATGYIFSKNDKLAITELSAGDDDVLKHIQDFQHKVQVIRDHVTLLYPGD